MTPTRKEPQFVIDTMRDGDAGKPLQEDAYTRTATWLANAADDPRSALSQWETQGLAPLACGRIFSAVRIPARLVWAAAGTQNLNGVNAFISWWFYTGAAFMDLHTLSCYALVRHTVPWRWSDRELPGVEHLGSDNHLQVPAPRLTESKGRAYWCRPMESPGELCYMDEVAELVRTGLAVRGEGKNR
jgi:hypothetical protein